MIGLVGRMGVIRLVGVLVVIVIGVEDVQLLLLFSGKNGANEAISVEQSIPRVHGGRVILLVLVAGRPKDNLTIFPSGSLWSHQGSGEAGGREDQKSLHVDGTCLGRGCLENKHTRERRCLSMASQEKLEIFYEENKPTLESACLAGYR